MMILYKRHSASVMSLKPSRPTCMHPPTSFSLSSCHFSARTPNITRSLYKDHPEDCSHIKHVSLSPTINLSASVLPTSSATAAPTTTCKSFSTLFYYDALSPQTPHVTHAIVDAAGSGLANPQVPLRAHHAAGTETTSSPRQSEEATV